MKRCRDCGESKPIKHFHKSASHKDGRSNQCSQCHTEYCRRIRNVTCEDCGEGYYKRKKITPCPHCANPKKNCTKCGKRKPLSMFYRNGNSADGRQSRCITCRVDNYGTIPQCTNCAFSDTCNARKKDMDFDPYCFVESKYHDLYLQEYETGEKVEREFNPNLSRDKVAAMWEELIA